MSMQDVKQLSGECSSVVFRLYRTPDDKFGVEVALYGDDEKELDSAEAAYRRPLTVAVDELVRAVHNIVVSVNRGKLKIVNE